MNDIAKTVPTTRRSAHADVLHGREVPDPYRWLEDPESEESRAWIAAQNEVTFGFLSRIPAREPIRRRITTLWDYEKYGVPFRRQGREFFLKNDGLQNQDVVYWQEADGQARTLLDPNGFSEDGTVALAGLALSEDGRLAAYGTSDAGSDWQEWRVREVDSGRDREDHLRWVKFSGVSWTHDGAGFFYSRYDEPTPGASKEEALYWQKLYYHRLGTPQAEDVLVYERRDEKEWGFGGGVTDDGRYLVISVWRGTDPKNAVFVKDLRSDAQGTPQAALDDPSDVIELLPEFDASYGFVGNDGETFWIQTDLEAPRGRLLALDLARPEKGAWRELIPEGEDTLEGVTVLADRFVAVTLHHAHSRIRVHALDGRFERELELPGLGTASGFPGRREDRDTWFAFTSFTRPTTIYRWDLVEDRTEVFRAPQVAFDPDAFETRQVFVESKDGTRVPLFLSARKGLLDAPAGPLPTYLYGYGGFNISLTPSFSVGQAVWMELGGVFAVACLRGGGEYGEDWHQAGCKQQKQNVFDDFIACAEHLQREGITSRERLGIGGGSNGGLLVGACMTQRPDLFAAALPAVGVLDMLRFHQFTIGWAWTSDYGDPKKAEDFETLLAYSPYHNLKPGTAYPATLVTTADHDDRVVPAHSFKFAAALQHAHAGEAPVLIRIETRAGHGAGKPTGKVIEEIADRWAFLTAVLKMDLPPEWTAP